MLTYSFEGEVIFNTDLCWPENVGTKAPHLLVVLPQTPFSVKPLAIQQKPNEERK